MESIATTKPNIAVVPPWRAAAGQASTAFAEDIMERNRAGVGFFGPLPLVYMEEGMEAPPGAPSYTVHLALTLKGGDAPKEKAAAAREVIRLRESLSERIITRYIPSAVPGRIQTIGSAPLAGEHMAGYGGKPRAPQTAGRALGEPAVLLFQQVLVKNQAQGKTASERAPEAIRAFAPEPQEPAAIVLDESPKKTLQQRLEHARLEAPDSPPHAEAEPGRAAVKAAAQATAAPGAVIPEADLRLVHAPPAHEALAGEAQRRAQAEQSSAAPEKAGETKDDEARPRVKATEGESSTQAAQGNEVRLPAQAGEVPGDTRTAQSPAKMTQTAFFQASQPTQPPLTHAEYLPQTGLELPMEGNTPAPADASRAPVGGVPGATADPAHPAMQAQAAQDMRIPTSPVPLMHLPLPDAGGKGAEEAELQEDRAAKQAEAAQARPFAQSPALTGRAAGIPGQEDGRPQEEAAPRQPPQGPQGNNLAPPENQEPREAARQADPPAAAWAQAALPQETETLPQEGLYYAPAALPAPDAEAGAARRSGEAGAVRQSLLEQREAGHAPAIAGTAPLGEPESSRLELAKRTSSAKTQSGAGAAAFEQESWAQPMPGRPAAMESPADLTHAALEQASEPVRAGQAPGVPFALRRPAPDAPVAQNIRARLAPTATHLTEHSPERQAPVLRARARLATPRGLTSVAKNLADGLVGRRAAGTQPLLAENAASAAARSAGLPRVAGEAAGERAARRGWDTLPEIVYDALPQETPEATEREIQPVGRNILNRPLSRAQAMPRQGMRVTADMRGGFPREGPESAQGERSKGLRRSTLTPVKMTYAQAGARGEALHEQQYDPAPAGYQESAYVQSLPSWARDFLKDSFNHAARQQGPGAETRSGRQGDARQGVYPPNLASPVSAAEQQVWAAPGYAGPAKVVHKQKADAQQQPLPVRLSDAEINRMANRVYGILEERLKRNSRRSGL